MMVTDKMSYRPNHPIGPIVPILPIFPIFSRVLFLIPVLWCLCVWGGVWRGGVRFFMGALRLMGEMGNASLDEN